MLIISAPLIVLFIIMSLYYSTAQHKKLNQPETENIHPNTLHKIEHELGEMPAVIRRTNRRGRLTSTEVVLQDLKFSDIEIERMRAGYIHKSTGKRKLSRKNGKSYLGIEKNKLFDINKIVKVMQDKLKHEYTEKSGNNSLALKLQAVHLGTSALVMQGRLPNDFVIPDDCVVHRIVKEITYGEIKQIEQNNKHLDQENYAADEKIYTARIATLPKIKALKINFKVRRSAPIMH